MQESTLFLQPAGRLGRLAVRAGATQTERGTGFDRIDLHLRDEGVERRELAFIPQPLNEVDAV